MLLYYQVCKPVMGRPALLWPSLPHTPRESYETLYPPDFADAGCGRRLRHFRRAPADHAVLFFRALQHARPERPSFPWLDQFPLFLYRCLVLVGIAEYFCPAVFRDADHGSIWCGARSADQ